MSKTMQQYQIETMELLMHGKDMSRPIRVRNRVERLIAIEKLAKEMCKNNSYPDGVPCPFCGYSHKSHDRQTKSQP